MFTDLVNMQPRGLDKLRLLMHTEMFELPCLHADRVQNYATLVWRSICALSCKRNLSTEALAGDRTVG